MTENWYQIFGPKNHESPLKIVNLSNLYRKTVDFDVHVQNNANKWTKTKKIRSMTQNS
jgi:hypothetical protein